MLDRKTARIVVGFLVLLVLVSALPPFLAEAEAKGKGKGKGKGVTGVPEIDPTVAVAAGIVIVGGILILAETRRRKGKRQQ